MKTVPFVDRPPISAEIEKLRLVLSTYQDGSGMLRHNQQTLPGWRDFERAVAFVFNAEATEDKGIYDVLLSGNNNLQYGISCKMRGTLNLVLSKRYASLELSNAAGEFWDKIKQHNITPDNYDHYPAQIGYILLDVVNHWYQTVDFRRGGNIDNTRSFFLTLQWSKSPTKYQLFQFPILLPSADELVWEATGRQIRGNNQKGQKVIEWFGLSGGQLKYYPPIEDAIWQSSVFTLEPLPDIQDLRLWQKVQMYFPNQWKNLE